MRVNKFGYTVSWLIKAWYRLIGARLPASFDADWYGQYYLDVAKVNIDPVVHYLFSGRAEGRLPYLPPQFDADWYRRQYPDIAHLDDPLGHYWHSGAYEGRDPGPGFSTSGYLLRYPEAAKSGNALAHFLSVGAENGLDPVPDINGEQEFKEGQPVIVVCGHQAGRQLYGAERSLLDIVTGLNSLGVNLVVVLPSAVNSEYVSAVRKQVFQLSIIPYGWWQADRPPVVLTQNYFEALFRKVNASMLYANTLVLDEPILVARKLQLPVVVHVRELPAYDEALCESLAASSDRIIQRLKEQADKIVVNSLFTAQSLGVDNALVVPNVVNPADYEHFVSLPEQNVGVPTVAMISSNLPKKGLEDFVSLAELLNENGVEVRCLLIGPNNEHTQILREQQAAGVLPSNIEFIGYIDEPQKALTQVDILVNLSYFQESFGRTVLEGMAAGKPVVAYRWGALTELIVDDETGYLVPLGNVQRVAEKVALLTKDSILRLRLGQSARAKVAQRYATDSIDKHLYSLLQTFDRK